MVKLWKHLVVIIFSLVFSGYGLAFEIKSSNFVGQKTNIAQLADQYDVIVVNPDGNYGAWYLNSPVLNDSQYETYIAEDVVNDIDNSYLTNRSKMRRGITGLSMGGFGALNVAINNQQVFAAVTSMSGGVDLRPFAAEFGIAKVLGECKPI